MTAFYNEIDPFAAAWLRELIAAGQIAPGVVDERSIEDIPPHELASFTQCHFFAGIGVWSYAIRQAGWPDDRPVWTGSCPCQPFSAAGKGAGFADERHLWPAFFHLISERRPDVVLGEQVASKDGLAWLDLVQTDLEGAGYASGAVDTCAAGFGAPHIRQRLYWVAASCGERSKRLVHYGWPARSWPEYQSDPSRVADANDNRSQGWLQWRQDAQRKAINRSIGCRGTVERMAYDDSNGRPSPSGIEFLDSEHNAQPCRSFVGVADDTGARWKEQRSEFGGGEERSHPEGMEQRSRRSSLLGHNREAGTANSVWRDADWLFCRDGKWRPVEPGAFPLAHGAPARVGRLRGYGNAINASQAQAFIEAAMECLK